MMMCLVRMNTHSTSGVSKLRSLVLTDCRVIRRSEAKEGCRGGQRTRQARHEITALSGLAADRRQVVNGQLWGWQVVCGGGKRN